MSLSFGKRHMEGKRAVTVSFPQVVRVEDDVIVDLQKLLQRIGLLLVLLH